MSIATVESMENRLTGRLAGRLAAHVHAPNLPVAAQVVSWMDLVDLCRELDDALVFMEMPAADVLSLHDAVLALGIGSGTWLVHHIQTNGSDLSGSGQTIETLEASLELLHILYRSRHPEFTSAEIQLAEQRIFNASA
jgi:hypothetical protein